MALWGEHHDVSTPTSFHLECQDGGSAFTAAVLAVWVCDKSSSPGILSSCLMSKCQGFDMDLVIISEVLQGVPVITRFSLD